MRPSIVLLIVGLLGIGWAMVHAFTGDSRCAERCAEAGYDKSRYVAPYKGNAERCSCVLADGSQIPAPGD